MEETTLNNNQTTTKKQPQGVIWGKDPKHFEGRVNQLKWLVNQQQPHNIQLISTAHTVFEHSNIRWLGHQTTDQWMKLLAQSKYLMYVYVCMCYYCVYDGLCMIMCGVY